MSFTLSLNFPTCLLTHNWSFIALNSGGHLRLSTEYLVWSWSESFRKLRGFVNWLNTTECHVVSRKFYTWHIFHTNVNWVVNKNCHCFFFALIQMCYVAVHLRYVHYIRFLPLGPEWARLSWSPAIHKYLRIPLIIVNSSSRLLLVCHKTATF